MTMDTYMVTTGKKLKILKAIVGTVAVDVVHVFGSLESAANLLLDKQPVFVNTRTVWQANPYIAAVKAATAIPKPVVGTFHRKVKTRFAAEFAGFLCNFARPAIVHFAALLTNALDCRRRRCFSLPYAHFYYLLQGGYFTIGQRSNVI